ncbi:hypothetical protein [Streptomyces incanus]|uniref:Uncharacterized protein n=1 Tax=Streptomyces incanus TaxID=887453 RepID=A0ABW0XUD6_9ACTN
MVLDDAFIRAAETAEPSARTRMLTERRRHEEPEPQPWRSDEPPAGPVLPQGMPTRVAPPPGVSAAGRPMVGGRPSR